jgi:hypothetical protein
MMVGLPLLLVSSGNRQYRLIFHRADISLLTSMALAGQPLASSAQMVSRLYTKGRLVLATILATCTSLLLRNSRPLVGLTWAPYKALLERMAHKVFLETKALLALKAQLA